jgi:hypothetical protein
MAFRSKKKSVLLFICALVFSAACFSQIRMDKIHLLNHKISMLVPTGFSQMSGDMLSLKWYNNPTKPSGVLAADNGKWDLEYRYTNTAIDDNGIPGFTDSLMEELKANKTTIDILDDGIILQDGKNIGYISSLSKEKSHKRFNYYFYISLDNRLLLFHFSCSSGDRHVWESKAIESASSIRITQD